MCVNARVCVHPLAGPRQQVCLGHSSVHGGLCVCVCAAMCEHTGCDMFYRVFQYSAVQVKEAETLLVKGRGRRRSGLAHLFLLSLV